jgi:septum formation protein
MVAEPKIVLASASRRRQDLLRRLGIPFLSVPSRVEEDLLEGEGPEEHVLRLCEEKARAVGRLYPERWIIGADTIVLIDDVILGKPRNRKEALWMLDKLQGRAHEVYSGVCVLHPGNEILAKRAVCTRVHMKPLSQEEKEWYLRTGEPFDKAGGYAIQGFASVLIREIEGSYTNVVGLPIPELVEMLRELNAWNLFSDR